MSRSPPLLFPQVGQCVDCGLGRRTPMVVDSEASLEFFGCAMADLVRCGAAGPNPDAGRSAAGVGPLLGLDAEWKDESPIAGGGGELVHWLQLADSLSR